MENLKPDRVPPKGMLDMETTLIRVTAERAGDAAPVLTYLDTEAGAEGCPFLLRENVDKLAVQGSI